jgi:hypothetical protein
VGYREHSLQTGFLWLTFENDEEGWPSELCTTLIAVVKSADLRHRDHSSCGWWFDWTRERGIPFQGKVGPRLMIITEVRPQDPSQMVLVQHNHVIKTLPPDGSDQPFHECPLPRTGRSGPDLLDPILGTPQRGFSSEILRIRFRTSLSSLGRPTGLDLDFQRP